MNVNKPIPVGFDHVDHVASLPTRQSPSRLAVANKCLLEYYLRTIVRIETPPTVDTVRGQLFHSVAEHVFDLPLEDRTAEEAKMLIVPLWQKMCTETSADTGEVSSTARQISELIMAGSDAEATLFETVNHLVDNWFAIENVPAADPTGLVLGTKTFDGREVHVQADLGNVTVHGFVDRINIFPGTDGTPQVVICDYKTGKVPPDRFLNKTFAQLKLYALAFNAEYDCQTAWLRLIFLKGTLEKDASPTPAIRQIPLTPALLDKAREDIGDTVGKIQHCAETRTWKPSPGPLCNWCFFATICPTRQR